MRKLFFNGDILTMENILYVDAILIENGIIKDIGIKDELISLYGTDLELIDLKGKTLMPSFIDPHSHITAFSNTLAFVSLTSAKNFDDIIKKINDFKNLKNLKEDELIVGFGYDNNNLVEKEHPTKDVLDKSSLTNPIIIVHASGHMGVLNSLALTELHISDETKNPKGGRIGRYDNSNEPNGYLEENAFINCSRAITPPSLKNLNKLLLEAQNIYLSYGITTAQDGMVNESEFKLLKYASDKNDLKIDVIGYVDLKNSPELTKDNPKYLKKYFNRFKIGGYKIFLDGSPQGRTAWLTKPYENGPSDYYGYPIYDNLEVVDFIKTALSENIQLLSHCNGDAACDQLINCFYEAKDSFNKPKNIKPVMIHAQTVRYDQLDRMNEINMIPSFFTAHTYYFGDVHIKNLGRDRAFRISPAKSALNKKITYTFHQDTPVILPNMLETVWCAVNRISKDGVVIGDFERISPLDALRGITINGAYQYSEEDLKGSIKIGKLADLVVLDRNPLKVDPIEIKNINVLETIKEGVTLYKK
ncbi:amidohydrolase [Clostridium sp.]|uniref:amidohydrolase n=1 Tax=Clostridium sp. TaxID=1506 RepID=UPI002FC6B3E6